MNATKTLIGRLVNLILAVLFAMTANGFSDAFASNRSTQPAIPWTPGVIPLPVASGLDHPASTTMPHVDLFSSDDAAVVTMSRLSTGEPQTVTVQVAPASLIANSNLTATVTVNVVDADNIPVPDVTLNGTLSPSALGSVTMLGPTDSNGNSTGIWTAGSSVGDGVLNVTDGNVIGSANVALIVDQLVLISVSPSTTTLAAGATAPFTARGYDQYNNPITVNPLWTVTGNSSIDANSGVLTASTAAQSDVIVAATQDTVQGPVTGAAIVDIVPGPLHSITVAPNSITMTVGATQTFAATGFDQYSNLFNLTPIWTASNTGGAISANGVFTAGTSVASGVLVTATQGGFAGAATINIVPGPPAVLSILPTNAVISAGISLAYSVIAHDAFGNSIGDVTAGTTFSITPAAGAVFVGSSVTPTVKNIYLITAIHNGLVATTTLTVTPASFARLSIEDAPAGSGSPIGAATLSVYQSMTVYAAGYDRYNNLVGARSVTWNATGILSGTLSPTSGISTTAFPAPAISGVDVIKAASGPISTTTGLITVQAPVLQVRMNGSPNPVTPGDQLQYTIYYTNAGSVVAHGVVITETYSPSVTYDLASPLPDAGTNNVWSVGDLGPGTTGAIVVSTLVSTTFPAGNALTSTVAIGASKSAPSTFTTGVSTVIIPNLYVTVIDSFDPVRVGNQFSYLIQYVNLGTFATNVRITDTYPSQVTYQWATDPPTLTPTAHSSVWVIPSLPAGDGDSILVTVQANNPITDLTQLNNIVAISSDQQQMPYQTNQPTLVQSPLFALSQSVNPTSLQANSLLTYTLLYVNNGSTLASSAFVTDVLPLNTSFQSCEPVANCFYSAATHTVRWPLGSVSSQGAGPLTLTVMLPNNVTNGLIITNTASISDSLENVWAGSNYTSTIVSAPSLALSMSDGVSSVAASSLLTYTLGYVNNGTAPAQNVVITEQIPSVVSVINCSVTCTLMGSGVYSFSIGTVIAGASSNVLLTASVNSTLPPGMRAITTTAGIKTTTPGDDAGDNSVYHVDSVSTMPALALSVSYDSVTPYETKTITYTLHYTNTSAMDTTGVVITVTRSPYVTVLSGGWLTNDTDQYISVGDLPAFGHGLVTYVISLPVIFSPDMTSFVNQFSVQDAGPGGLPIASADVTATIGIPDLVIDAVSLSPGTIIAGQKFTATIIVRNQGTGRACNPQSTSCVTGNPPTQGGTYLDAFVSPPVPPSSYGYIFSGFSDGIVNPLGPGLTETVIITGLSFTTNQVPVLYFKIDNYECYKNPAACSPSNGLRGLVPENNEYNNVSGPILIPQFQIYLPLIRKSP